MAKSTVLRLALAQVNVVVGDLDGNVSRILDWIRRARDLGADVVTFPELALTGYPPEDLLLKPRFIDANMEALEHLAGEVRDIVAIVGFVDRQDDIYNAAAVLGEGAVKGVYHKRYLPNYGVFDEFRYFQVGRSNLIVQLGEVRIGLSICEDIWYPEGPSDQLGAGAELVLNLSSSPYHEGKRRWREQMLSTRAVDNASIVAYNNLVGGQDELVFDGDSIVFDPNGQIIARGRQFEEDLVVSDLPLEAVFHRRLREPRLRQGKRTRSTHVLIAGAAPEKTRPQLSPPSHPGVLTEDEEIYRALTLGTRDYVRKNAFQKVVIGLSGGVDSALTAAIAVDALGADNVVGVLMPSPFSSKGSIDDSEQLSRNLSIRTMEIPIADLMAAYDRALSGPFSGEEQDVTEENLQARIRGNLLMALSNKFGWLVLSTGNKSEISVGYCTLYGDMAGGFAVLKDVTKTMVYRLARTRNCMAGFELIPDRIIAKPPSAELRPDQKDTDSLPPYDRLDPILKAYIEDDLAVDEIIAAGADAETVRRVVRLVDASEYKRRQTAPGVKITPRAFGRDRRMPITNRFPN